YYFAVNLGKCPMSIEVTDVYNNKPVKLYLSNFEVSEKLGIDQCHLFRLASIYVMENNGKFTLIN
uniref:hypothetical protein n=1 Tax=Aquibacillus sediminis TaxID=2574734 RepID=UPI001AED9F54